VVPLPACHHVLVESDVSVHVLLYLCFWQNERHLSIYATIPSEMLRKPSESNGLSRFYRLNGRDSAPMRGHAYKVVICSDAHAGLNRPRFITKLKGHAAFLQSLTGMEKWRYSPAPVAEPQNEQHREVPEDKEQAGREAWGENRQKKKASSPLLLPPLLPSPLSSFPSPDVKSRERN